MDQAEIITVGEWQTKETLWGPITFRINNSLPDLSKCECFIRQAESAKKYIPQIEKLYKELFPSK
jgi:hypothetical protein